MKWNSWRVTMFLLFLVVLLGGFLRFYQLGHIPLGLNKDESSIGYNAYSILKTGRDEYGYRMPLYFKSFADYKLPIYIYSTVLMIKLFGLNAFAVRFTSALWGTLSIVGIFFLTKYVTKNTIAGLFSALLLAVNPWNLFFSRAGFEVNVATSFLLIGTVFLLKSCSKTKYDWMIFLSVLFFGLSIYTYNSTRFMSPLLFILLLLVKRKELLKSRRTIIVTALVLGVLIYVPIGFATIAHTNHALQDDILLVGPGFKPQALALQSYLGTLPFGLNKILFNTLFLRIWQYIRNLFAYFSVAFFFITGPEHPINGIQGIGMFYPIELIFIVIGFVSSVRQKILFTPIYIWLAAIFFAGAFVIVVPHPTRHYLVTVPFYVLSGYGAAKIMETLMKKKLYLRICGILATGGILLYSVIYYLTNYFYVFPRADADVWRTSDKDLTVFVLAHAGQYKKVIFDNQGDFSYSAFLFYAQVPPADYQLKAVYRTDGNLSSLSRYGKYVFKSVDWRADFNDQNNILVITDPSHIPPNTAIWKTFYFPTRPVVNVVNDQIQAYPYTPPSYVLIEKHS